MRVLLILLLLLPVEHLAPDKGFRMSDRILFVVDTSGSMTGLTADACDSVLLIAESPVDGFQIGLITFDDTPTRWKGLPECKHKGKKHNKDCVLPGWCLMPKDHKEFRRYLQYSSSPTGYTDAPLAIETAMKDTTPGLTIVLVTDGDFNHDSLVKKITEINAMRAKKKLPRIYILVWGVGAGAAKLVDVAKVGGGGLWSGK